jgi:hypothetical protein
MFKIEKLDVDSVEVLIKFTKRTVIRIRNCYRELNCSSYQVQFTFSRDEFDF